MHYDDIKDYMAPVPNSEPRIALLMKRLMFCPRKCWQRRKAWKKDSGTVLGGGFWVQRAVRPADINRRDGKRP